MRRDSGFTLPAVIFLLVILGGAATTCVLTTMTGTQHFTAMYAVKGAQAYNAAKSGIEWGVYQAIGAGDCAPANGSFPLGGPGLDGFTVTVSCNLSTHTESPLTYNVYVLTAFAESPADAYGQRGYVSRRMRVVVTDAP